MAHIVLSEDDKKVIEQWFEGHKASCPAVKKSPFGSIVSGLLGTGLSYEVIPSNIGTLCTAKCPCGATLDLPDEE